MLIVIILLFSTVTSFGVSEGLQKNFDNFYTIYNLDNEVTFISKSSGLDNPDKEEGDTELELADINNDGYLDIISVGDHGSPFINSDQHGIMVWFGNEDGTWSVNQVGNFGYGGIEAGDLNLDGYLDVVWGVHHNYGPPGFGDKLIGAALGDGTGSNWIPWATGLGTNGEDWGMFETDLADFDCNGLLDIVSQSFGCCNGYHVYENNGDGTWTHKWTSPGGNTNDNIEIGDFNADGYPDFAGNHVGYYVFLGDGDFGFTMNQNGLPGSGWNGLDYGDMNNDGQDDLVIGCGGVKCYIFDKQDKNWISKSDGLPTSGEYHPQFGDINGDGFIDIVAYLGPTGYLYLGDGTGNWESDATFTMSSPGEYSAFVVDGDFDHDGREDIVIQADQGNWPTYQNILQAFSPWLEPTELTTYVSSPHGGETFRSGSIRKIRWLSAVPSQEGDATVEIQISVDGDSGPWRTIADNIPNNGCYQWLIDGTASENCRIKIIVSTSYSSTYAISSSDFIIKGYEVDAYGPYQGQIDDSIQFTGLAENGSPPYDYHWDFGDSHSSDEQNPKHSYDSSGNYSVVLTVTDNKDISVRDSTWALILEDNKPPSAPIINGPTKGKTGIMYNYTFNSTDDNNEELYYIINWGDGIEDVIGVFPSGTDAPASHTWSKNGTYVIKAQAGDRLGLLGDWGSLTVTIPKIRAVSSLLHQKILSHYLNVFSLFHFYLNFY